MIYCYFGKWNFRIKVNYTKILLQELIKESNSFETKNFNKSDVYKINSIPPHSNEIEKIHNLFDSGILDIYTEIPHGVDSTSYQSPACVGFLRVKFPAQNYYRVGTLPGKITYVNKPMNRCFFWKLIFVIIMLIIFLIIILTTIK